MDKSLLLGVDFDNLSTDNGSSGGFGPKSSVSSACQSADGEGVVVGR